jgi:hypothetical protein
MIAACFLAAPAFAQTRVVANVEGFSAPVAPVAGATTMGSGAGAVVAPTALSGSTLFSAPSAPVVSRAPSAAPSALVAAAMPVLAAAPSATAAAVPAHETASIGTALTSPLAASVAVSHPEARNSREAAAVATVEGGVADWTARSAQSLEESSVRAAASEGASPLERSSAHVSAATPEPAAPAPEAPSKFKVLLSWAGPILALTALFAGIDFGTKFYAAHHLFNLFHEVAWRKPIIIAMMPYIFFTAYKMRSTMPYDRTMWRWSVKKIANGSFGFYKEPLSGVNTMIKDHPSLVWGVRLYDLSIALMLGGILGNGLDAIRLNGALDWIPLGRSLMNFADISLLLGLSYFRLASSFFIKAATAHKAGKSLYFTPMYYLGLPLAGVFIAWAFGSGKDGGALDLAMKNVGFLYLMAFSMLIGFAQFISAVVLNPFVKKFVAEESTARSAAEAKP